MGVRVICGWLLALSVLGSAVACSGDDGGEGTPAASATASARASTATASPGASGTARPGVTGTPAPTPGAGAAAQLAALHGLRCVGSWRNEAASRGGAFAVRVEAGGGGGLLSFEIGGAPFGGAGGVFEAPFRLVGERLEVGAASELLGRVSARIGLDGTAEALLTGPPALGPRGSARLRNYRLADGLLRFELQVERGDGSAAQTAVVEAACARR